MTIPSQVSTRNIEKDNTPPIHNFIHMRASINILQYEHGVISQVVDVLGEMVKKRSYRHHREHIIQIFEFIDTYVDRFHHTLEEKFIFPWARKISDETSKNVDMLIEGHREVRRAVEEMTGLLENDQMEGERFHELAHDLVEGIRVHIKHEEDELYPTLEDNIDLDEDSAVIEKIVELMNENFGEDFHNRYEEFSFRLQDEVLGPGFYEGVV